MALPTKPLVGTKAKVSVAKPPEQEWEPDVTDHERTKAYTLKVGPRDRDASASASAR